MSVNKNVFVLIFFLLKIALFPWLDYSSANILFKVCHNQSTFYPSNQNTALVAYNYTTPYNLLFAVFGLQLSFTWYNKIPITYLASSLHTFKPFSGII